MQYSYEGVRLELCTQDRPGLLSAVTRMFQENGLLVAQAENIPGVLQVFLLSRDRIMIICDIFAKNNGGSEDDSQREWEADLTCRLKEAEEMEELERTTEQLQSQASANAP
ncbi:hypothetical protein ABZP36_023385 [Zizania latifolia]